MTTNSDTRPTEQGETRRQVAEFVPAKSGDYGSPGKRQSTTRERIRRACQKLLPDYDFTFYPVLTLHWKKREGDRPAWSIAAKRKGDQHLVDISSTDTMSDCLRFGLKVLINNPDGQRWIQLMADWPSRSERIKDEH